MGLGILEDNKLDHVPGTSYILHHDSDADSGDEIPTDPNLKYDRSGKTPIILVPQPSDDPNDPLNWPLWKRDVILTVLSLVSVLCATASPLMAANTLTISVQYRWSFTDTALLTGYHLCGVGVAGFFFVPTARVWGKRHLFILGNIIMIFSSAWAGASNGHYTSFLWARVFQGIGLAPFEALVNAAVGDLYFVHERGKRMALSNVALFGGAFLTPVLVGKITHEMGWQWSFYFVAIFSGASLPLLFFFVPETAYRRASHLNTDYGADGEPLPQPRLSESETTAGSPLCENDKADQENAANGEATSLPKEGEVKDEESNAEPQHQPIPKASFLQSLKLFNGRKTDESFWKLLLRPFPLFFHPGIFWACVTQGVIIGWTVFMGVILAVIFFKPPLWFTEVQTGYLYTGAFIGSILGLIISGLLSDWTASLMTKWNKGKYEPEFRIVLVVFQLIFSSIGLYGFAYAANDVGRYGWLIPDVFFMFVIMGMVMGAVATALYIVDAHRQIAIEAFTCLLVFKNMFSFVLTYYAYDWVSTAMPKRVMIIIASVQVGICLLSIPMYVFGKRNRSFFHRHDILKILGLW
ncbi:hypothetical protein AJ80_05764 [Polytolypa hystricis UAMH7299]|uniref:Major facilitator superfamily (MFS) profile domain-containing protein n=1 Tax=Polytolypa hystricis (strain UAMH7299) TaxID=1447883 RepID=A0A2B7Y203_POLH7|nr:hypothetical protein AJ80_05764 [Polytolypa hystricis UAMH7299]